SIVRDVNLCSSLLNQRTDYLTAWSNDVSNLIWIDLDLNDAGCSRGDCGSRLRKCLFHCAHDMEPAFFRLLKGLRHNLCVDAPYFDVHLQGSDPVSRSCPLEIHVAIVI